MKKKERDLRYKVFTVRLSIDTIAWLKDKNKHHKSWNIFFKDLKEKYGNEKL